MGNMVKTEQEVISMSVYILYILVFIGAKYAVYVLSLSGELGLYYNSLLMSYNTITNLINRKPA